MKECGSARDQPSGGEWMMESWESQDSNNKKLALWRTSSSQLFNINDIEFEW